MADAHREAHWALALLCFLAATGCSGRPRPYPIDGKVMFEDGSPVTGGRIEFRSLDHQLTARGGIEQDGTFQMTTYKTADGAVKGKHQVLIVQQFAIDFADQLQDPKHSHGVRLDRKYNRFDTSGLEVTVLGQRDPQELVIKVRRSK